MDQQTRQRLDSTYRELCRTLNEHRNPNGCWRGRLAGSALATAVAAFSLGKYDSGLYQTQIESGREWLRSHQNADGGWGDTVRSNSNISTTLVCWAALFQASEDRRFAETLSRARQWLSVRLGSLAPETVGAKVLSWYGSDRTFSVPILTMCCMAGCLGPSGWKYVPQLPFELAVVPDRFFRLLQLSVVSYAIPALIAIGLVRHRRRPTRNPFLKLLRACSKRRVMAVLAEKQAENGGFLEAAPLTGFVLMSLVEADEKQNAVCSKAAAFLSSSMRDDGCWPIDTDLSTWVTIHAVKALAGEMSSDQRRRTADHLRSQQFTIRHPFTHSEPGGWAWTDLPGGVPDADDTAGALIALALLEPARASMTAATSGICWLLDLQNSDGGFPTFCRGWGRLPFDRSTPDITAHVLSAFSIWEPHLPPHLGKSLRKSVRNAVTFLHRSQQPSGSWLPLWFGNEGAHKGADEGAEQHANPVYGTSIVVCGLVDWKNKGFPEIALMIDHGLRFLRKARHEDGGFGGAAGITPSVEETSLAILAFAMAGQPDEALHSAAWLIERLSACRFRPEATPIGLYFASLWYFEELYPLVFAGTALRTVLELRREA